MIDALDPIVTVVIPTRGRPQLLARAIRSVLAQTMQRFEIVVVLDGEDPVTDISVRAFDDSRLRLLKLSPSAGGAAARNAGVDAASGDWIAFLDDDDEFLPSKLELQLQAARCSNRQTLVVSRAYRRSQQGDQIWPSRFPDPHESICEYLFCRNQLRQGSAFLQTSTFFLSRGLAQKNPFRSHLRRHQDWDWVLQLLSDSSVQLVCMDQPLSIYHTMAPPHTTSVSRRRGWKDSLNWGREVVLQQSRTAYSFFIATQCVTRLQPKETLSWRVFARLSRECFLVGKPSRMSATLFIGFWLRSFIAPTA
jgi:hypothetical protein